MQLSENKINAIVSRFGNLEALISKHKERYLKLKEENKSLLKELKHLEHISKIQKNSIAKMEVELKLKKTSILISKKEETSAKFLLNELIEEVNNCIKIINSEKK